MQLNMTNEIVLSQLNAGSDLSDMSNQASHVVQDRMSPRLIAHGAHYLSNGQFIDDSHTGIMFAGWDSEAQHQAFASSR